MIYSSGLTIGVGSLKRSRLHATHPSTVHPCKAFPLTKQVRPSAWIDSNITLDPASKSPTQVLDTPNSLSAYTGSTRIGSGSSYGRIEADTHTIPESNWDDQPLSALHFHTGKCWESNWILPSFPSVQSETKDSEKPDGLRFVLGAEIQSSRARLTPHRSRCGTV